MAGQQGVDLLGNDHDGNAASEASAREIARAANRPAPNRENVNTNSSRPE